MNDNLFDQSPRMTNGVKIRRDGGGDSWALRHREELGNYFYMQDLDFMMGMVSFAQNTEDSLFVEFVPDNYRNVDNIVRNFGVVGMFDRKQSFDACNSSRNMLSKSFYMHLCRSIAQTQAEPPKFLYVAGGDSPPWQLREVDILTGQWAGDPVTVSDGDWSEAWRKLGLLELRNKLNATIGI